MIIGNKTFDTKHHGYIMGILNVTPDSFSDGGKYDHLDAALKHAEEMIKDGAAIIDVGGESTRPGYTLISDEEEIGRVTPVIEALKKEFDVPVSLDTYKSGVARAGIEAGADLITLHAEATKHLHRAIQQVKAKGLKVGVALNPATPLSALDYVLEELDMVLIMTVNPGYGGQSYIAKMDDKIKELRAIINEKGLDIDIEVDGGISAKNVAHVKECGANVFVAGSAVFNGDIASSTKDILEAMEA